MMRRPFDLDIIGKNLGIQQSWKPDNLKAGGSYAGQGPVDATPRLYVRSLGSGPLFVVAGKPLSTVFELWQKEAYRIGAVVLVLILFVLASTLVLAREIGRRADAESKLEEMATTDALTGLRNRRKFDHVIDIEWRRAMRQKTQVALLMIDADHFKAYNDTFGHQAGDQLLVGIAICISDSVRRAGDCAARYGGEEFAVLLPNTSVTEAFKVAELIRGKVQGWSDDGAGSTVSCGIASLAPTAGMDWSVLVAAADKALYAAKAGGRNQSVVASIPRLSLVA
jgi:diguanylate cyclase (GGDEF)-like protein